MIVRELLILNKHGLHARPATLWVQAAAKYQSSIRLKTADREVDGKSLLAILSLGLSAGSTVQLMVDGPDAEAAADALTQLVAELGEKES
ncbi:HPr family phosphocarrier protein [Sporomusa aerivorans]|uniref:HPr family phosphocarrier protein n=1 Tax=Sporomusa aerivorans TaxID=204936 RepID=UPI00352BAA20